MQKLTRLANQAGNTLVFAIMMGMVISIMGIAALHIISGGSSMSQRDIEIVKSFWANEGSLRVALRYISCVSATPTANIAPFSPAPRIICNGDTPSVSILAIANANGTYCYTCSTVTIMPSVGLRNTTVLKSFSINSMSRYTWFEQQTSSAQWKSMAVHGDYHTNGYINAGSSMTNTVHVSGKATTAGRINSSQQVDRAGFPSPYNVGFRLTDDGGREVTTEPASWFQARIPNYAIIGAIQTNTIAPTSSSFNTAYTIPTSTSIDSMGIQLAGTSVKIWKRQSGTWSLAETKDVTAITGGILKSAKPTYVWGTLDGKLTIVTSNTGSISSDIVLGSDIQYANTNLSTSDDVLALVSVADVVVPNKTNNSTTGMVHNFTQSGGNIYGSLFMSSGKIDVQNISGYTSMQNLNIYGGVLLNQSTGTYSTSGGDHGISGQYYQDPRFVGNAALAPGIPYANAADPERSSGGSTVFMYVLGNGTWRNTVGAQ